jgi:hypothetical protein
VDKVTQGENMNFGLVDVLDNAYDGVEDQIATGVDAWGFRVGGETKNHGNFIGPVRSANQNLVRSLADVKP